MMGETNLKLVNDQGEVGGISGGSGKLKDEEEKIAYTLGTMVYEEGCVDYVTKLLENSFQQSKGKIAKTKQREISQ